MLCLHYLLTYPFKALQYAKASELKEIISFYGLIRRKISAFCLGAARKARILLLVDLREFLSDSGSGDEKRKKKSSENDRLTVYFQSFVFLSFFSELFFNKNSKTSKVHQQSVLNL